MPFLLIKTFSNIQNQFLVPPLLARSFIVRYNVPKLRKVLEN